MAGLPSKKQKAFALEILKGSTGRDAALQSYELTNPKVADQISYRNMRSEKVQTFMAEILDKQGVTDEKISASLGKIIDAGLSSRSLKAAKPADSLRALEMVNKLKDNFPATRKTVETKNASIRLSLQGKSVGELKDYLQKLSDDAARFEKIVIASEDRKRLDGATQ